MLQPRESAPKVPKRKFGSSRADFFGLSIIVLKLLAVFQPLFFTYLTNRGIPFDLLTGWLVMKATVVYKPDNFWPWFSALKKNYQKVTTLSISSH
ncbi:MAG: hypothetical protein V7K97_22305 [Nostoc sp.]|uniref:hypothetical protein n=1 Tax=Nostoc sp. TaxID=1180 RepID=UPI002FF4C131